MEMKKSKMTIVWIIVTVIAVTGITLLFKNLKGTNFNDEKNNVAIEERIESKIEKYITENGKEYSKDVISGENSFFVGGIGKSIKSYDLNEFKPEDFDIYGLIDSVPESCKKFGADVIIENEEIVVNIYTEEDKFYKDE